jgi:hypothetical protein
MRSGRAKAASSLLQRASSPLQSKRNWATAGAENEGARVTFRDREKARYRLIKHELFSAAAQADGVYRGIPREFCLAEGCENENLYEGIRERAISYFADRGINWHGGGWRRPSNHLCSSQVCCVNFLFPFTDTPGVLARVFRHVYPDLAEALPIDSASERPLEGGGWPYVAFEWIGEHDYLTEGSRSRRARVRGANFTSADFLFRFRRADGHVQVVLGEWKYTESYGLIDRADPRRAGAGSAARRLETYRQAYDRAGSVFRAARADLYRPLFFEPFYQLMRLQLLAQEMEHDRELGADIVSVLHVSPEANREFRDFMPSSQLQERLPGSGVLEAWQALVPPDRFMSQSVERLRAVIGEEVRSTSPAWVGYLERRYGWR